VADMTARIARGDIALEKQEAIAVRPHYMLISFLFLRLRLHTNGVTTGDA